MCDSSSTFVLICFYLMYGMKMREFRKFARVGPSTLGRFILYLVLVDEGIDDPNTTKIGPSSARQRNAI